MKKTAPHASLKSDTSLTGFIHSPYIVMHFLHCKRQWTVNSYLLFWSSPWLHNLYCILPWMSLFQNEEFFKQNPFHNIDSPLPLGFPQFFSILFKIKGWECVHSVQKGSSYRCLKWFNDFSFVLYSFPNSFKHCLLFSTTTQKLINL